MLPARACEKGDLCKLSSSTDRSDNAVANRILEHMNVPASKLTRCSTYHTIHCDSRVPLINCDSIGCRVHYAQVTFSVQCNSNIVLVQLKSDLQMQVHSCWSGYFSSYPGLKLALRKLDSTLRHAEILSLLATPRASTASVDSWERALGWGRHTQAILQHHDAITGTGGD